MNWTIFLRWVVANFLGGVVGYLTGLLIAVMIGGFHVLLVAAAGAVIGLAQWQVLRDYLGDIRALRWVGVSALGFVLSMSVFYYLEYAIALAVGLQVSGDTVQGWVNLANEPGSQGATAVILALAGTYPSGLLGAAAVGLLGGAIIGATQWIVLRGHSLGALWWVLANALAGLVGAVAAVYLSMAVYDGPDNIPALFTVDISLSPPGVFIIGSIVTGFSLMYLARNVQEPPPTPNR
jgi:hypothetical protein